MFTQTYLPCIKWSIKDMKIHALLLSFFLGLVFSILRALQIQEIILFQVILDAKFG